MLHSKIFLRFLFVLCAILGIVSISSYSLWIDETYTALYASMPSIANVVATIKKASGSEAQMPGYIFSIWLWEKITGHSEIALRSFNLISLFSFYMVLYFSKIDTLKKTVIALLVALSPFVCFNLNEARSTISLLSLAGIILVLIENLSVNMSIPKKNEYLHWIFICCIVGFLFNMLFAFFIIAILVFYILENVQIVKNTDLLKQHVQQYKKFLFYAIPFVLIGCYYLYTVMRGAGGMKEKIGITNIGFAFYEFLGFLGLGTPRNILRDGISFSVFKPCIVGVAVLATVLGLLFFILIKQSRRNKQNNKNSSGNMHLLLAALAGIIFFILVATVIHFRFWGRHLAFFYPMLVFVFAAYWGSVPKLSKVGSIVFAMLLLCWSYSCFNLRFEEKYQKENYKLAIAQSLEYKANNKTVMLCGAELPANYYGLKIIGEEAVAYWHTKDSVYNYQSGNSINNVTNKILILFRKYDLSDPAGKIRNYIKQQHFYKLSETKDFIIYKN